MAQKDPMDVITVSRRVSTDALDWINDNPLPTAGATMAAISAGYLIMLLDNAANRAETTIGYLDPTVVLSILRERPTYVLAFIVGVSILTLWRE